MSLLEKFDKKYKLERARLIAENYNEVVGKIHKSFQNNFINQLLSFELQVVEIVKFDYMTNLHSGRCQASCPKKVSPNTKHL